MKDIGHPIQVKGKIIRMVIRDEDAWTVESIAIARRTSLQVLYAARMGSFVL